MEKVQKAKLPRLHGNLADVMLEHLKGEPLLDANGRAVLAEDGRPIYLLPKANVLKEVREFLKDNGIDREPVEGDVLTETQKTLRKFDDTPLELENGLDEEDEFSITETGVAKIPQ